ncbi:putative ABC transport system ATP-binding protein/lipoprotein-releasing system ATP-binding protein [Stackebrandtia endophytica]|uniref:Putative ABC transport system ATP-binding protein/lipoprotein-releasing system ATP-binding protein n=1 Tax=Stackebrandtia endophytica TaxID=1496996 RepID=A0A543AV50_9ACTN|nr:ABC transporter ATP-binding protein [Stackebrandtia endophytica]TQL76431.1 putative ABC transport system ATP-binding protein/lipoprotein-releasing system ATP-binding protein [Stackebrandtia endophytica]
MTALTINDLEYTVLQSTVLQNTVLHNTVAQRRLFNGLDLSVENGQSVAILGPSGSGKSTLLSCVLGLVRPQAGSIRVAGHEITALKGRELARLRSEAIGMVFQFGELLPELTPLENVELAGMLGRSRDDDLRKRASTLLSDLGVRLDGPTENLSGGERQRTAVCRALINSPSLLLADEPTGALDAKARAKVARLLFAMPKKHHCGLLVATHDLQVAQFADEIFQIADGVLEPVTSPERDR